MADDEFSTLIERVRAGSEEAARELFERYNQQILRVVRRRLPLELRGKFDSLDFTQATWASVFAKRSRMTPFENPGQFIAYVGAVAANKVGMEIRRRMKGKKFSVLAEVPLEGAERVPSENRAQAATPSELAIAQERWSLLLRQKSPKHQRMIRMRMAGYTLHEIAAELGFDERTIRRVMKRMANEIERD